MTFSDLLKIDSSKWTGRVKENISNPSLITRLKCAIHAWRFPDQVIVIRGSLVPDIGYFEMSYEVSCRDFATFDGYTLERVRSQIERLAVKEIREHIVYHEPESHVGADSVRYTATLGIQSAEKTKEYYNAREGNFTSAKRTVY